MPLDLLDLIQIGGLLSVAVVFCMLVGILRGCLVLGDLFIQVNLSPSWQVRSVQESNVVQCQVDNFNQHSLDRPHRVFQNNQQINIGEVKKK